MPTVAEPIWPERAERRVLCVVEFVRARSGSIDDSEDVLRARLFGLGLRADDLQLEITEAKSLKSAFRRCPRSGETCMRKALTGNCECSGEGK